jgi:hypothetical protein
MKVLFSLQSLKAWTAIASLVLAEVANQFGPNPWVSIAIVLVGGFAVYMIPNITPE